MRKRYVIISKFRFTLFIIFLLILSSILINLFLPNQIAYGNIQKREYDTIHISKGDTLWNIAKEYNTKKYDLRRVIHEIEITNNISNANIHPGDIIKIPIY